MFFNLTTGKIGTLWNNPYKALLAGTQFFFNVSAGATESILANYIVYRFQLFLLERSSMLFYIVCAIEVIFISGAIGTIITTRCVVPAIGMRSTILIIATIGTALSFVQAACQSMHTFFWMLGVAGLLAGGTRALIMICFFGQAANDEEKGELAAAYRMNESLGKFFGKLLVGTTYMANFIEDGGMLCSFAPGAQKADGAATDMGKGLWQGDFQNVLADFSEDERCHVGFFGTGNNWGAGEPWAICAYLQLISLVCLFASQLFCKKHGIYKEKADATEAPAADLEDTKP